MGLCLRDAEQESADPIEVVTSQPNLIILLKRIKKILLAVLTLAIATFLLYWCFREIDLKLFWEELFHARPLFLLLGLLSIGTIIFSNAAQWQILLPSTKPVRFLALAEVVSISLMTANTIPWGHAAAIYFLGRVRNVGHTVALSVMTLDQLFGGLSKAMVYVFVIVIAPLPLWLERAGLSFTAVVVCLYVVLVVLSHRHRELKVAEKRQSGWWGRLIKLFFEWAHYLQAVRDWRCKVGGIGYGLLMRAAEALAIYCVQWAFGAHLPFWAAWFVVMAINLAIMVPITPGNLGVYEATVFFVYKSLGVEATLAMTMALFTHVLYLIPMVIPGYLLMVRKGIHMAQVLESTEATSLLPQDTVP